MQRFLDVLWAAIKLSLIAGFIFLGSCSTTRTILKQAPVDLPPEWQSIPLQPRPEAYVRRQLQSEIYGRLDIDTNIERVVSSELSDDAMDGLATLLQYQLTIDYGPASRPLDMILLMPKQFPDAPVILSQNFCPNDDVVPLPGVRAPENVSFDCSGGGVVGWIMTNVFGRYIVEPPLQMILERGYGFAAIYPGQIVPDSASSGLSVLDTLFPEDEMRPGALAVWSDLFDLTAKQIDADFGDREFIAYGHSRFGKTALLSAAWSNRIDGAIAHQSGTLGASSLTDEDGEPLKALVESYPQWPGKGLTTYIDAPERLPVRPADLLSLTGGKPILLGNARRDVWSDPWGAFTEAKAAWGSEFGAQTPTDFRPQDKKAYWLRPGTHGVVKEDWPAFLEFLDAHFSDASVE